MMNKIIVICAMLCSIVFVGCEESTARKSIQRARQMERAQETSFEKANNSIPVPEVNYFQERRTITKWVKTWDKPNIPCYVYLISYGKIIGYYVTDGKPSSTTSYVLPEYIHNYHGNGACCLEPTADLDGTYGHNNPGIRFFTAEGIAVEWGGDGASYLYSDAPLPIDVPRLNTNKKD